MFFRTSISASDLRSQWEQQDVISATVSGAHTKYNTPNDHPRNYITKENSIDLGTAEAFYEMKTMLFDYADAEAIVDFIGKVQNFSLEYQVRFFAHNVCVWFYTCTNLCICRCAWPTRSARCLLRATASTPSFLLRLEQQSPASAGSSTRRPGNKHAFDEIRLILGFCLVFAYCWFIMSLLEQGSCKRWQTYPCQGVSLSARAWGLLVVVLGGQAGRLEARLLAYCAVSGILSLYALGFLLLF